MCVIRSLFITLCFLVSVTAIRAQQISGMVVDAEGKPVAAVTVGLRKTGDSTVHKWELTNAEGRFRISAGNGSWLVEASHVGYAKAQASVDVKAEPVLDIRLVLVRLHASMTGITIAARKPMIEMKADRMIINVEGTLNNVGTTAMDVLRKSPGVNVDNEDNISLSGKNGVQVFIDGRLSPLTGSDLGSYLSSLQSAQIEAIEIISNPSAKYEAAGNGGIINIRLKKNKSFGTNGSVNAGYGIGSYSKYNAGISLNHRNRLVNIFGSYTYADSRNLTNTYTYRELADTVFEQQSRRIITDKPHNIQAGLDWFLGKQSTLGLLYNGLPGTQQIDNTSTSSIRPQATNMVFRRLDATGAGKYQRTNNSYNLNYRYARAATEFNVDADHARYRNEGDQFQPNYYYDAANNFLYSRIYSMLSPSDISMFALKVNYDRDAFKGKISVGGKWGLVESINSLDRFNVLNTVNYFDSLRSNDFTYREKISAWYGRYTREYKKLVVQAGLRMEQTKVNGYSTGYRSNGQVQPYDSSFTRSYLDFFPSASLTLRRNPDNQISINAGRRIDRPAYQDLNPFEFKVDEYLSRRGNTNLRPQYTTVVEVVHLYKNRLTTLVGYSHVADVFTQIFDTTETSRTFITKTNVATQDLVNLSVNYTFQGKKYNGFINLNPSYNKYRSDFGKGRELQLKAFSYAVRAQVGRRFEKGFAAEISGQYIGPGIGLGFFTGRGFGNIDIALQQSLLENRIQIRAAVSDLFFTNRIRATSLFAGQFMRVERSFEPRLFRISLSYRFGSSTVKSARQRKTLLEEENRRLQTSN